MVIVRPMHLNDIPDVMEVNEQCFTNPWSSWVFRFELTENQNGHWMVLEEDSEKPNGLRRLWQRFNTPPHPPSLFAFAGFWLQRGEAHISNICVGPSHRGRGFGELLLAIMLKRSIDLQAEWSALEVRVTNEVAIALYRKYGFRQAGRKVGYYRDNNEDAYLMVVKPLDEAYRRLVDDHLQHLTTRITWMERNE